MPGSSESARPGCVARGGKWRMPRRFCGFLRPLPAAGLRLTGAGDVRCRNGRSRGRRAGAASSFRNPVVWRRHVRWSSRGEETRWLRQRHPHHHTSCLVRAALAGRQAAGDLRMKSDEEAVERKVAGAPLAAASHRSRQEVVWSGPVAPAVCGFGRQASSRPARSSGALAALSRPRHGGSDPTGCACRKGWLRDGRHKPNRGF